jgi:diguanylate cyclase (GGDEF)-like protein
MTNPDLPQLPKGSRARKGLWPARIAWRLTLGLGVLVALVLLALAQSGWQLRMVSEFTQRFATGDMQRLLRVQALTLQTEGAGSALVRLVHAPREDRVKEYANVDARNRTLDGIIESLSDELMDSEQEATLRRLVACRANYAKAFIATVDEIEADNLSAAVRILNDEVNPALNAMLQESGTLLQRERERVEKRLAAAEALFERVAMWLGIASLAGVSLASVVAWRTTRSVVAPLAQLEDGAFQIALGDYSRRIPDTGTQEVDRVGHALNTMAEAVSQREQQIVRLAYQDSLTGMPNRTALLHPHNPAPDGYNALLLLDLARLKAINETLGFTTGDTLIKELAMRCQAVLQDAMARGWAQPHSVAARLSGGSFAMALRVASRHEVERIRDSLLVAMAPSVSCSGHSVDVAICCGLAGAETQDAVPVDILLRNAEVALHSAKRSARDFTWHSAAQEAARLDHLSLVSDLRAAVAQSQLQMWLQPKFALANGRAVGAEALVRWVHPQRGFISPAEFVPFAEQTGYITLVTDWMLREALRTLQLWERTHPALSIAVNVSTRDLQDAGFAQRVGDLVAGSGVNPQHLRLEITESGLMEDAQKSVELLHGLRALGLPLSIDDFGTGYSSLAYLQKLPVSELKIDRSFVDGIDRAPGTQKLVRAMTEMGHGMDLMVTAEGVETEAERNTLINLGCDVMQGYLGSRPLHGAALQDWLGRELRIK